jgi:NADPH-dependent 7-cyano-7-deazaguanine reductase QueF
MLGLVVYQILCSYDKSYTNISFKEQLKEHKVDRNNNRITKSTIVQHSFKSNHLITLSNLITYYFITIIYLLTKMVFNVIYLWVFD